jgi:hypothetical protein
MYCFVCFQELQLLASKELEKSFARVEEENASLRKVGLAIRSTVLSLCQHASVLVYFDVQALDKLKSKQRMFSDELVRACLVLRVCMFVHVEKLLERAFAISLTATSMCLIDENS